MVDSFGDRSLQPTQQGDIYQNDSSINDIQQNFAQKFNILDNDALQNGILRMMLHSADCHSV